LKNKMKRTLSVALLSIMAAAGSFAAQAPVYSYQINVPFAFMANGHYVPAGPVTVECDKAKVRLSTPAKGTVAVLPLHGIGVVPGDASLYFKRAGWGLQLTAVKDPATGKVRVL
jgi:hypothetical protein